VQTATFLQDQASCAATAAAVAHAVVNGAGSDVLQAAAPALLSAALAPAHFSEHALPCLGHELLRTAVASRATRRASDGALCLEVHDFLAPDAAAALQVAAALSSPELATLSDLTLCDCLHSASADEGLLGAPARLSALTELALMCHSHSGARAAAVAEGLPEPAALPAVSALVAHMPMLSRSLRRLSLTQLDVQVEDARWLGPALSGHLAAQLTALAFTFTDRWLPGDRRSRHLSPPHRQRDGGHGAAPRKADRAHVARPERVADVFAASFRRRNR
jgi:hypothetical protein